MARLAVFALTTLALLSSGAAAQAQAVRVIDGAEQAQPVTGDPNRRICKERKPTGTRLSKGKTCLTAKQWADRTAASHDGVRALQRPGGLDGDAVFGGSRQPGNLQTGRPQ